ncbi:centrosomal protein kizuna [Pygocentrus nattereri]|uniref:Centrosomal protein kizuna n=1 Tax=Pygocentrus nattereri TaxID=42514 RepID=A0A3B4BZA2_PYGNA|nr:centrosomal protein kizuna [Pygocentrus nattereri]
MAFCSNEYYDTIGSIHKSIHEREKRRHELEEELFTYSRSEDSLAKQKYTKMRHYHKELCKREQQAKARNLELLRNVESLVSNAKEFSIDYSVLHHLKLECRTHITRILDERNKREGSAREAQKEQSRSFLHSIRRSPQPSVIFTGRQTLKGTLVEDSVMSAHSPSLTELIPNHPSASLLQSGPLMDARVSKANGGTALSDDILNSDDFPAGTGDTSERRPASDCGFFRGAEEECGPEQLASPHMTLKASGVSSHHRSVKRAESSASLQCRPSQSPSPDTTYTSGPSRHSGSGEQARVAARRAEKKAESAEKHSDDSDQSKSRSPSIPSSDVEITPDPSLNTASDVSVSQSDSFHEQHSPGGSASMLGKDNIPSQGGGEPKDRVEFGGPLSLKPESRLSMEGFFYLLDSIEERLPAKDDKLYSSSPVSEQKLRDIIRLCSQRGGLKGEELSVCGAVVLQQLPWLSWNMSQGCLLPSDLVNTHWSTATDATWIRSCLSSESAALWDRWFTHVLQLLQQEVLPLDSIVQLFTPLLVHNNASYTGKAEVLLKRLLTRAAETHHLSESEESSCSSLPSLLHDSVEIKLARLSKKSFNATGTQGVQSGEEDRADQSPVESIPIRETKAYQLLKQSVTQEKQWRNTQEEGSSDLELSGFSNTKKTEKSERLHQESREDPKTKVQAFSAVQSKAFWGDSDDSNSEIEMALRPRSHNASNDDFDDFYD